MNTVVKSSLVQLKKSAASILVAFLLAITVFKPSLVRAAEGESAVCGDINNDGAVDVLDFTEIFLFLATSPSSGVDLTEDGEFDGNVGLTLRDLLVLEASLWSDFVDGICPATLPQYQLSSSSDFMIRHQTFVPAGVSSLNLPLFHDFSSRANAFQIPLRFLIDGVPAEIDSIDISDNYLLTPAYPIAGEVTERNLIVWANASGFPFGEQASTQFATARLSFPASTNERSITLEMLRRPALPTLSDSLVEPAIYRSDGTPLAPIGYIPVIRNYLCGDASGDGSVDIIDLTLLVDYLYISFALMPVQVAGNVNATDEVDVLDLTALVSYLFLGGPPPGRC